MTESGQDKKNAEKNRLLQVIDWINKRFALLLFVVSILCLFLAWLFFDASILYPIKEIGYKQQESRYNARQLESKKEIINNLLKLGNEFLDVGNYIAARKEFKEALELDKNNMNANIGLFKAGIFEQINGEYDPEVVEKRIYFILQKDKEDPHAFVFLGEIYYAMGEDKYKEAETNYLKAIKLGAKKNPKRVPASAYAGLGLIYDKQDRLKEAVSNMEQAVKLSKWNQRFLNNLAYLYSKTDQYQKAIDKYYLILQLDSAYLLPFYEIASLYRITKDIHSALYFYSELVKRLKDEKIASLPKNTRGWYFGSSGNMTYIYTLPEKQCYAYYSLSLTLYLNNKKQQAVLTAQKARDLKIERQKSIIALMIYDLKRLKKAAPDFAENLDQFQTEVLNSAVK